MQKSLNSTIKVYDLTIVIQSYGNYTILCNRSDSYRKKNHSIEVIFWTLTTISIIGVVLTHSRATSDVLTHTGTKKDVSLGFEATSLFLNLKVVLSVAKSLAQASDLV